MKENQAFNEMMVHTALCTHKEAKNVSIVGTCKLMDVVGCTVG